MATENVPFGGADVVNNDDSEDYKQRIGRLPRRYGADTNIDYVLKDDRITRFAERFT